MGRRIAGAAGVGLAVLATMASSTPGLVDRLGECLTAGPVDTVEQLDALFHTGLDTPQFAGADVGTSLALQDGRQLFVFADTLRVNDEGNLGTVHNSMLVLDGDCLHLVLTPDDGPVLPDVGGRTGYWPMSVTLLARDGDTDVIGVSAQRIRTTSGGLSDGLFSFDILGSSVAVFEVPRGEAPRLREIRDLDADVVDPGRPVWGAASVVSDGWLYLYGTAREADPFSGFSLRVARVRPADFTDAGSRQYWDGQQWSSEVADAVELLPSDGGVSQTLSVFSVADHWYALSKRDDVLGRDLTLWSAPAPTGPFTVDDVLGQLISEADTGTLRYLPLAHPDLLPVPGTIVVSYNTNNLDFGVVVNDPEQYRLRFLRVSLPG